MVVNSWNWNPVVLLTFLFCRLASVSGLWLSSSFSHPIWDGAGIAWRVWEPHVPGTIWPERSRTGFTTSSSSRLASSFRWLSLGFLTTEFYVSSAPIPASWPASPETGAWCLSKALRKQTSRQPRLDFLALITSARFQGRVIFLHSPIPQWQNIGL